MNVCAVCIQSHFNCNVLSSDVNSAYIIPASHKHISALYWQNEVTKDLLRLQWCC